MAKEPINIGLESQHNDKSPLLEDPTSSYKYEEIVSTQSTINDSSPSSSTISNVFLSNNSYDIPSTQNEVIFSGPCCNILTTEETPSRNNLSAPSLETQPASNASTSFSRPWTFDNNQYDTRQRTNPLNSRIWISIEFITTLGQIIASIIVLSSLDLDDLLSLLSIWIIGYTIACLTTLPLLYWRYKYRYILLRNQEVLVPPQTTPSTSSPSIPPTLVGSNSYVFLNPNAQVGTQQSGGVNDSIHQENRFHKFIEKFKVGLDCFFAIWFIIGNVWVFSPRASSYEKPNLHRLCVVFLSLSCIAYAMPFVLCSTLCCCLSCIVALLGFREERHQSRGASLELIAALPTYKFKAQIATTSGTATKEENELDNQGGFVGEGTENRRLVLVDDALCCICLGKYKDKVELRELPCSHHFHIDCVDKWLKINASCPLCKYDLISGTSGSHESNTSLEIDEIVNIR